MFQAILGDEVFFIQDSFIFLIFRFFLNGLVSYILIERIYKKINDDSEYLFTFYMFNILIFFVASLLVEMKMKTGFAFGLFAIFSILRYRTEQLGIKEMTFLFISIVTAVINSTVTARLPLSELIIADIAIITLTYFSELEWLKGHKPFITIHYENIELIDTKQRDKLIEDLTTRTGLNITNYEILSIDYLNDSAKLKVFYK